MIDRLRFLLDQPLDLRAARAVVVLAAAVLLGFGALIALGISEGRRPPATDPQPAVAHPRSARSFGEKKASGDVGADARAGRRDRPGQDPQDEHGAPAAARAARALRTHRALQHVPYRKGRFSVRLIGAREGRAVLAVSAPTSSAAHRGWRAFLRRYRDDGRAYSPWFRSPGGIGG